MISPDVYFPNLGISFQHLNRVAFSIFGYKVYNYGLIICVAATLGVIVAILEAKRTGQSPDDYIDFTFWGILFGVLGARTYYILFNGCKFNEFFAIRDGGLAIYGGIIGAIIALIVFTRKRGISTLLFTDTAAMSLLIGQIFGRWGNFFNREAFGKATTGLFAMAYRADQVSGLKVNFGLSTYNNATYPIHNLHGVSYIWVHPTFLYESCWNFILLLVIFLMRKHKKFDGQLTATYFIGYGIGRFFIESLRTDQLLIFGLPVSMVLSAILVIVATVFMIYKFYQYKNAPIVERAIATDAIIASEDIEKSE